MRELRNVVERAAILTDRVIAAEDLPAHDAPPAASEATKNGTVLHIQVGSSISEMERGLILATLEHLSGDKKRAAEVLGISLKTLYDRFAIYAAQRS